MDAHSELVLNLGNCYQNLYQIDNLLPSADSIEDETTKNKIMAISNQITDLQKFYMSIVTQELELLPTFTLIVKKFALLKEYIKTCIIHDTTPKLEDLDMYFSDLSKLQESLEGYLDQLNVDKKELIPLVFNKKQIMDDLKNSMVKIDPKLFDLENEKKKILNEKQMAVGNLMRQIHSQTVHIASNNGKVNDLKLVNDLITSQINEEKRKIANMQKQKEDILITKENNQMEVKDRIKQLRQKKEQEISNIIQESKNNISELDKSFKESKNNLDQIQNSIK